MEYDARHMARTAGTTKEATHERIVQTAARAIRKHGYDGVSVADVMKQAGLTHGGFYAHFASREAMLEEALDWAAADGLSRLVRASEAGDREAPLASLVAAYLSDRHVEHPESGCSLAALGSETARQAPELRRVATRNVGSLARLIASQLPGSDRAEHRAEVLTALASMVGALVLARAVDDPALSRELRGAVTQAIAERAGEPS